MTRRESPNRYHLCLFAAEVNLASLEAMYLWSNTTKQLGMAAAGLV